jgi:hypothetical protein
MARGVVGGVDVDVDGEDPALPQLAIGDGEELATSVEENCEDVADVDTIVTLKLETVDDTAEVEKVEGMAGVGEAFDRLELGNETAGVELATSELNTTEDEAAIDDGDGVGDFDDDDLTEVANVGETFELGSCPLH